jgi:threonyl-tRNA synthetase
MLVVGDREVEEQTVAVRTRKGGDQGAKSIQQFIDAAEQEIRERRGDASGAEPTATVN